MEVGGVGRRTLTGHEAAAGDIGTPVEAGETTFDGAAFTLTASGELGPAGNDAFQFVRQPRSGDFTLTARMDDFSGGTQYA
ncbi:MAG: hypothetical protein AAFU38_19975, partial [Bacteroidota bacterium]